MVAAARAGEHGLNVKVLDVALAEESASRYVTIAGSFRAAAELTDRHGKSARKGNRTTRELLTAAPNVERHEVAWHALERARLSPELRPSRKYEQCLVGLMTRFLRAEPPTQKEFDGVTGECLAELRTAHYPDGVAVFGHDAEAWRRAGEWLKIADEAAAGQLG